MRSGYVFREKWNVSKTKNKKNLVWRQSTCGPHKKKKKEKNEDIDPSQLLWWIVGEKERNFFCYSRQPQSSATKIYVGRLIPPRQAAFTSAGGQDRLMDSSWAGTKGRIRFYWTGSGDLDLWQLKMVIILYTIPGDVSPRGDLICWSNGPELNDKIHGSERHRQRYFGGFVIVSGGLIVDTFHTPIHKHASELGIHIYIHWI